MTLNLGCLPKVISPTFGSQATDLAVVDEWVSAEHSFLFPVHVPLYGTGWWELLCLNRACPVGWWTSSPWTTVESDI